MMFKGSKKEQAEPEKEKVGKAAVPASAGAPSVAVRKTWVVGRFEVVSNDGQILISSHSLYNLVSFPKEYAAAIADAILQAS